MAGIMNQRSYRTRNYRAGDFEKLAALYVERSRESGRNFTSREISAILKRPGFDPGKDILVATAGDNIIGYAHMTPEPGIGRLFVTGWIDPAFRRKGLATGMLDMIRSRGRALNAPVIAASVHQENRLARTVLPKLGFRYARRYLDFGIDITDLPEIQGAECRPLRPGEEHRVLVLQNRAFDGHWRYNPYDIETFLYDINLNNRSSEDIIVYCDGDFIAGYCWTESIELSTVSGTETRGIINMLGVDEPYRQKGVGRSVLIAGLAHLKQKGASFVSLQVDSENAVARELYHSVGFREFGSALWYEQHEPQETGTGNSSTA